MDMHEIAAAIAAAGADAGAGLRLRQGMVDAVALDGTITVRIGGSGVAVSGVRAFTSASVAVGTAVWLAVDGALVIAVGVVGAAAAGGLCPAGTGYVHVTDGVLDAAAALPAATTSVPGTMSAADKTKMDGGFLVPTGAFFPYVGRVAPPGYLLCDGAEHSRSAYPALFAELIQNLGSVTFATASPATFTRAAHGLVIGDRVYLTTTGSLGNGNGLNPAQDIWVSAVPTADTFQCSGVYLGTSFGSPVVSTGGQSGTHTLWLAPFGGGDKATTFNVPDMRARLPVGVDLLKSAYCGTLELRAPGLQWGWPSHNHPAHSFTPPGPHDNHSFTQPTASATGAADRNLTTGWAGSDHTHAGAAHTHAGTTNGSNGSTNFSSGASTVIGRTPAAHTHTFTSGGRSASTSGGASAYQHTHGGVDHLHGAPSIGGGAVNAHSAHMGGSVSEHGLSTVPYPYTTANFIIKT
jgi:microcystin-dependent protein